MMSDRMASDGEPIPTRAQIYAARVVMKGNRRLGRDLPPGVIRDAEWPLVEVAPYPGEKSASDAR